ncbi:RDD family protein [Flexivirga meconopsidis]|uniref:RDD family protein n=1 Tax=Flexivirga meconopsidis TaxID=2977121 RepID=UPI0022404D14|nr:RDD family protein [Flexivirga meconopsidis]
MSNYGNSGGQGPQDPYGRPAQPGYGEQPSLGGQYGGQPAPGRYGGPQPDSSGQYGQPTPGQYGQPQYGGQPPYGGNAFGDQLPPDTYASWGQRVGAYLVDALVALPGIILYVIGAAMQNVYVLLLGFLLIVGIQAWNRWYKAGTTGQSIGKGVMHVRLVSADSGRPIGPLMAFVRDLCHFVDGVICYIGYLFPLWDRKRQTLADKIVGTVVPHGDK